MQRDNHGQQNVSNFSSLCEACFENDYVFSEKPFHNRTEHCDEHFKFIIDLDAQQLCFLDSLVKREGRVLLTENRLTNVLSSKGNCSIHST